SYVRIVAEIGSNYDGSLETAQDYIRAAAENGADAVKFQTLTKETLIAPRVLIDDEWVDSPVYQAIANLELPDDWHHVLKRTADEHNIEFISTPFYLKAVSLLEDVGVATYKIASSDITFEPLLDAVGRTGKQVLLSTGASSLGDVERAIDILSRSGAGDIVVLHCVSNYPPQFDEMNLHAITTLKEAFGLPVGISDHSPGSMIPIAAVALGATVIEKHVTFDQTLPGPDHPFAMPMDEFGEMVSQVRLLEAALGTGRKSPTETESAKQHRIRRGIYDPVTFEPTDGPDGVWLRPEHGRPY
ncbi:N-acetylneuraminate synthase family protein, partial [Dehalococcoidia bacterium]|nr:N-acetylneuraminate synthase family protein [Dehalococcoidia bacterium]